LASRHGLPECDTALARRDSDDAERVAHRIATIGVQKLMSVRGRLSLHRVGERFFGLLSSASICADLWPSVFQIT
jgi:hypothetical protein